MSRLIRALRSLAALVAAVASGFRAPGGSRDATRRLARPDANIDLLQ
jgi:hypothetical protein